MDYKVWITIICIITLCRYSRWLISPYKKRCTLKPCAFHFCDVFSSHLIYISRPSSDKRAYMKLLKTFLNALWKPRRLYIPVNVKLRTAELLIPSPWAPFSQSMLGRHSHQCIFLPSCHHPNALIMHFHLLYHASTLYFSKAYINCYCFPFLFPATISNSKAKLKMFCVFLQFVEVKFHLRTFTELHDKKAKAAGVDSSMQIAEKLLINCDLSSQRFSWQSRHAHTWRIYSLNTPLNI